MRKFLSIFILLLISLIHYAQAADRVWLGGADTNFHDANNWQDGILPGVHDIAVFNGLAVNNAIISNNISVGGFRLEATFLGSILHLSGKITISTGGYLQDGGTFVGGTSPM